MINNYSAIKSYKSFYCQMKHVKNTIRFFCFSLKQSFQKSKTTELSFLSSAVNLLFKTSSILLDNSSLPLKQQLKNKQKRTILSQGENQEYEIREKQQKYPKKRAFRKPKSSQVKSNFKRNKSSLRLVEQDEQNDKESDKSVKSYMPKQQNKNSGEYDIQKQLSDMIIKDQKMVNENEFNTDLNFDVYIHSAYIDKKDKKEWFEIQIIEPVEQSQLILKKSLQEIKRLYQGLMKIENLPKFPVLNKNDIEKKKVALRNYLQNILNNPKFQVSTALKNFLELAEPDQYDEQILIDEQEKYEVTK